MAEVKKERLDGDQHEERLENHLRVREELNSRI
jgi:hypothetical protein